MRMSFLRLYRYLMIMKLNNVWSKTNSEKVVRRSLKALKNKKNISLSETSWRQMSSASINWKNVWDFLAICSIKSSTRSILNCIWKCLNLSRGVLWYRVWFALLELHKKCRTRGCSIVTCSWNMHVHPVFIVRTRSRTRCTLKYYVVFDRNVERQ